MSKYILELAFEKDIYNYSQQLDSAIAKQGLLSKDNAILLSWGHLKLSKLISYDGLDSTATKDGQVSEANNITLKNTIVQTAADINHILGSKHIILPLLPPQYEIFWLGKDIHNYQTQWNKVVAKLNPSFTPAEGTYVDWYHHTISNRDLDSIINWTVTKDGLWSFGQTLFTW